MRKVLALLLSSKSLESRLSTHFSSSFTVHSKVQSLPSSSDNGSAVMVNERVDFNNTLAASMTENDLYLVDGMWKLERTLGKGKGICVYTRGIDGLNDVLKKCRFFIHLINLTKIHWFDT